MLNFRAISKHLLMYLNVFQTDLVLSAYIQLSGNTVDIVTTVNGRELLLFMKLRSCNRAQWEIRDFAVDMLKKLRKADPTIFNFYGPSCYVNKCTEGAMTCGKSAEIIKTFKEL